MKFKINRDHFSGGLQQVLNVVGTRATMPILSNVLIETGESKDHITLTTTNLDLGIRCRIKAEVTEAGGITLPVRKLTSIVRDLPSLEVAVEATSTSRAKVSSGSANFHITGLARDEFPPLPTFADKHSFTLQQSDLKRMLKSVSYAESTDETRYIMNGVYFNFEGNELTLAATDGRRLAVIRKELEVGDDNAGHLILPAKTVAEVERLLDHGETVRIAFNDRQVAFDIASGEDAADEIGLTDSVYLVSKVVEGNYPNYRQVIPSNHELHVKLNRENFLSNVRRAALVTTDKNNSVRLRIAKDILELSSQSPELGEASVSMAVEYEGDEVEVAFNPVFLQDPLKALTNDEVIFEFKDDLSPGVIRTNEGFLCVIMPLRLN